MVNGKVEQGRALGLGNAHVREAGRIVIVVVAAKTLLQHTDVGFGDGNDACLFDGHVQGPGAVVVVKVDGAHLTDGVCALILLVGDGGVLIMEVTPGHHTFVQDTIAVVGLNFAEFYGFPPGHDVLGVFTLERKG